MDENQQLYHRVLTERLYKRRIENKMPKKFTTYELVPLGSTFSYFEVLKAVEQSTSGQFALIEQTIGFSYASDMTMFLMSYVPSARPHGSVFTKTRRV